MALPEVFDSKGKRIIALEPSLYKDFFVQVLTEKTSLCSALEHYTAVQRSDLETYIVHRLAEVDPGFTP